MSESAMDVYLGLPEQHSTPENLSGDTDNTNRGVVDDDAALPRHVHTITQQDASRHASAPSTVDQLLQPQSGLSIQAANSGQAGLQPLDPIQTGVGTPYVPPQDNGISSLLPQFNYTQTGPQASYPPPGDNSVPRLLPPLHQAPPQRQPTATPQQPSLSVAELRAQIYDNIEVLSQAQIPALQQWINDRAVANGGSRVATARRGGGQWFAAWMYGPAVVMRGHEAVTVTGALQNLLQDTATMLEFVLDPPRGAPANQYTLVDAQGRRNGADVQEER